MSLINSEWDKVDETLKGIDIGDVQREMVKRAYYAGAQAAVSAISGVDKLYSRKEVRCAISQCNREITEAMMKMIGSGMPTIQ